MKKTIFFSQILNQKMCLLSINSVQATIQEKSIDTFMAAGWGDEGMWGDGFLKQKRTYPNHLLDSCGRFWSKHHKTHGKTTSFTCNKKKKKTSVNSSICNQMHRSFSRRNRQMLSISPSVWSKYQQFPKSKPLSCTWIWRLSLANLL